MHPFPANQLIGKIVEGLYEHPAGKTDRSAAQGIYLRVTEVGYVAVEPVDGGQLADIRILGALPDGSRVSAKVEGAAIVDVLASEYLASLGYLCDNGCLVVNEVEESRNTAGILRHPGYLAAEECRSIVDG